MILSLGLCTWAGPLGEVRDLFRAGRYEEARTRVEDYLRAHPDDPEGLYWKGELEPDARASQGYYRRLLDLYPGHPLAVRARLRMAQYLYALGKYRAASEQLRHILEDFPDHPLVPRALCWRGRALMAAGEPEKARRAFQKALSRSRDSGDSLMALLGLSDAFFRKGLWKEALRYTRKASEIPGARDWSRFLSKRIDTSEKKPGEPRGYVLQVGAFKKEAQARRRCGKLRDAGYNAWVQKKLVRGQLWYAVWVGPYSTREEAQRASKAFPEAWILKVP